MTQDSQLQQAVLAELHWEPSVIAAHIGVTAIEGIVCLTGHVESFAQKHAAERAVRRVKNVKGAAAEIEVRLPFEKRRDDEEIAAAAIRCLAWDVSVRPDTVKVEVDQGWVTLTGQVDWHFEKNAAERDIRGLVGVIGVVNQITIKSKVSLTKLSDDIMSALHRSWFDTDAITVDADGGDVRLSGTVHSWHDKQVAGATARAAQGATAVRNDIQVV